MFKSSIFVKSGQREYRFKNRITSLGYRYYYNRFINHTPIEPLYFGVINADTYLSNQDIFDELTNYTQPARPLWDYIFQSTFSIINPELVNFNFNSKVNIIGIFLCNSSYKLSMPLNVYNTVFFDFPVHSSQISLSYEVFV